MTGTHQPVVGIDPAVAGYLDTNRDAHLAELAGWIAQPSVSATGEGFPEATDYAVDLVRRSGLAPRLIETAGRPAVIGHADGPIGAPRVLIYGHYDVQPPGPLDAWLSAPFELRTYKPCARMRRSAHKRNDCFFCER